MYRCVSIVACIVILPIFTYILDISLSLSLCIYIYIYMYIYIYIYIHTHISYTPGAAAGRGGPRHSPRSGLHSGALEKHQHDYNDTCTDVHTTSCFNTSY